jgi:hypothetical protein
VLRALSVQSTARLDRWLNFLNPEPPQRVPLTTHPDGLAKRLIAGESLPRPILEREPGCFETTPAAFPEYLG